MPNAQRTRLSVKHLPLPYSEIWARLAVCMKAAAKQSGIDRCRGLAAACGCLGL